jgi:hypothetical protein
MVGDCKIEDLKGIGAGRYLVVLGSGPSVNEVETENFQWMPHVDVMDVNEPDWGAVAPNFWLYNDHDIFKRFKHRYGCDDCTGQKGQR